MPFKPNYNFQKMERTRLKEAKKEEKLRARREQAERKPDQDPAFDDASPSAGSAVSGQNGADQT